MTTTRITASLIAAVAAVVAAPVSVVAGISGAGVWQALRGPPPSGGEGVQGDAYAAFFVGGPVGLVVGSLLIGWLALWLARRSNWPLLAALFGVLVVASIFAVQMLGSH